MSNRDYPLDGFHAMVCGVGIVRSDELFACLLLPCSFILVLLWILPCLSACELYIPPSGWQ